MPYPAVQSTVGNGRRVLHINAGLPLLAAFLLSMLVWITYVPTLGHGWAPLDDEHNFVRNPNYRGFSADHLLWMWTSRHMGHYIPLTWMTLAADFELSGMDPRGYHRTNILLHAANATLVFALAWRLIATPLSLTSPRGSIRAGSPWSLSLGALGAGAFFALHPLRVESVAWITERRDLLCAFFLLIAVHAYVSAAAADRGRRPRLLVGALAAFAGALLSKGIAAMLPVALLALDFGPLRRLTVKGLRARLHEERAILLEKAPFFALAAASIAVTFWAIAPVMAGTEAGLEHRLLSAGFGLSFYLEKTLLPVAIPFQVPATHLLSVATDPMVALRGFGFLIVFALALRVWGRLPEIALTLTVFTAFVLPVSGLFQAGPQLAAHRYTYLATLPLALLMGAGLYQAAQRGRKILVMLALFTLGLAGMLAFLAREKVALWRDDVTFCLSAVQAAPDHWPPVGALARAYLSRSQNEAALLAVRAGRERRPDALFLTYLEAVILATSPDDEIRDGELALILAGRASRATGYQDPAALFALAAASAEAGDAAQARRLLESAAVLSRAGRKPHFLAAIQAASRQVESRGFVRLESAGWEAFFAR